MRCRHYRSWLIAGGEYEWCYECGGLRRMKHVGQNAVMAITRWTKPTGKNGRNPYPMIALKGESNV